MIQLLLSELNLYQGSVWMGPGHEITKPLWFVAVVDESGCIHGR